MSPAILPIVEGQSEVISVPILIRRILVKMDAFHIQVARPFRVKRNRIVQPGELERAIEYGIRDRENIAAIFLLLDAEDDCPAKLGRELKDRCRKTTHFPAAVVLANKEFEGWFLGGKESLRGINGIRSSAYSPPNPENIRGAKERLTKNMDNGRRYLEVDDQPIFATKLDFEITRNRCQSFDKLIRSIENLKNKILGG